MSKHLRFASLAATLATLPVIGHAQTSASAASAQTRSKTQSTTQSTTQSKAHAKPAKKAAAPSIETQIRQMREELQGEIDDLRAKLATKDAQIEALEATTLATQQKNAATAAQVQTIDATLQQNVVTETSLKDSLGELQVKTVAVTTSVDKVQKSQQTLEKAVYEPVSFHYKGITITPGGFIAGESVWRQRALNSDIFTPFNSTPYMNAAEARTSEWVGSARGSRPKLEISGKVPFGTLNAVLETDFLSAGITSNNLQTNSYTMRVRQAWAQAVIGKFKFTGGQMWSLLTENRRSTDAGQENLALVFDGDIHVGDSYIRQDGLRVQDTFGPGITVAMSVEGSQYQFAATNPLPNFFFGAAGALGGAENSSANYTNQVSPDVIVKIAADPGYGHYELGGVARFFRDRYYPNYPTNATLAQNDTRFGGGFFANARFPVTPLLDVGLHVVAGDGTGRYGPALLPDVTVRPDGTLVPLRDAQGLLSLEAHPKKRLDLFSYVGAEYVQRDYRTSSTGVLIGYAPPSASNSGCNTEILPVSTGTIGYNPGTGGNCLGATRVIIEGTVGWIYRIYVGSAGKLQYGASYSYLTREAWVGVGGGPKATNNMVFTSFRYYLP